MHVSFVVARAKEDVIGHSNGLPWRFMAADMARFKKLTMGKPIIMGRKTWESLPRKPLPGRINIVVSRDKTFRAEGAEVVHSASDAHELGVKNAESLGVDELMVIGGGQIYKEMIGFADRIYLTEVDAVAAPELGDSRTFFRFDSSEWREVSREDHKQDEKNQADYSFVLLERG